MFSCRLFLQYSAVAAASALCPVPGRSAAESRILVVSFSRSGNTDRIAGFISEALQAEQFRLTPETPYPASYGEVLDLVREELRQGRERRLRGPFPDFSGCRAVFVGSPCWFGGLSVPVMSFLKTERLIGARVIPFISSGSSAPDTALEEMRRLVPQTETQNVFWCRGSEAAAAQDDVRTWLKTLRL